jgi:hypothetical protein
VILVKERVKLLQRADDAKHALEKRLLQNKRLLKFLCKKEHFMDMLLLSMEKATKS